MSASSTPAHRHSNRLCLTCPNCGKNLLAEGFYYSSTETTRVHEENRS